MSTKEWIKSLIESLLWRIETPRQVRRELKKVKQEKFVTRWFGVVPFALKMFAQRQKKNLFKR